jgi:Cytochrome P460
MSGSRRAVLVAAGLLAVWPASAGDVVPYPDGFRGFRHVKTTVVGKASPIFERQGGIHHFYANSQAVEGYRTGAFPDGAILIDDLLTAEENGGVTKQGPRRMSSVMVRDARLYADTGGWGFEVFDKDGRAGTLTPEGRAACHACHAKAKGSVFTELAE